MDNTIHRGGQNASSNEEATNGNRQQRATAANSESSTVQQNANGQLQQYSPAITGERLLEIQNMLSAHQRNNPMPSMVGAPIQQQTMIFPQGDEPNSSQPGSITSAWMDANTISALLMSSGTNQLSNNDPNISRVSALQNNTQLPQQLQPPQQHHQQPQLPQPQHVVVATSSLPAAAPLETGVQSQGVAAAASAPSEVVSSAAAGNGADGEVDIRHVLGRFENDRKTISQGASVIPCRARGISKDHNEKTAYFTIPKDLKHGDGLLCSHILCQNKGIRFVYCTVCDQPVAKVNFSTRHKHPEAFGQLSEDPTGKTISKGSSETDERESTQDLTKQRRNRNKDSTEWSSGGAATSAATCGGVFDDESLTSENRRSRKKSRDKRNRSSSKSKSKNLSSSSHSLEQRSKKRRKRDAPSAAARSTSRRDGQAKVGSSDSSSSNTTGERRIQPASNIESEWLALLRERPNKKNRKKMKAWMERVLFTSEYMAPPVPTGDEDSSSRASSSTGSRSRISSDGISDMIANAMVSLESIHEAISRMNSQSPTGSQKSANASASSGSNMDSSPTKAPGTTSNETTTSSSSNNEKRSSNDEDHGSR